jgi:hypothetical protein
MKPTARTDFKHRPLLMLAALALACLNTAGNAERSPAAAAKVHIFMTPPRQAVAYGMSKLQEALEARGIQVSEGTTIAADADFVIVAGTDPGCEAAGALKHIGAPLPSGAEALVIRHLPAYQGKPGLVLYGSDARGLMYAALDVAGQVRRDGNGRNPLQNVGEAEEKPFLQERGVSMYTMHRAYFESRLFDEPHWRKYFDLLAASRINNFIVVFGYENGGFMAPPYPYFFDVDEFPGVKLVGLSPAQQARNTAAFKKMMQLAHERGISITAAIWDHIYRGGVQTGGIPGAPKAPDPNVPGLVWGVTADNLAPYTKAALRRFLQVFPEVDAIQFRMHEESGLRSEEKVSFWHEVFSLIKQAKQDMRLDLRAKDLPDEVIDDALKQGLAARVSTKFWMEQMGLPFHPTHVNPQNQKDRRHGYADLLRYPQRYRVHWQLWNGGTTRLLLWADPEYVRRFAAVARLYGGTSFDVNEMLATKMLGEPHTDKPIEILTPEYRYYDYEFERYWHFYQLWGRLTYNPDTPSRVWVEEFSRRFGDRAGPHLMRAEHLASRVLPRIVASSYRYAYFPTTRGWAEMKRQDDLPTFAGFEGTDTQQFMNARDAARNLVAGTQSPMRWPQETSRWFAATSDAILAEIAQAETAAGDRAGKEFRSSVTDFRILAALARYYSSRLQAAVAYNLYKEAGDLQSFDTALVQEKNAIRAWSDIVDAAANIYNEKLPFGAPGYFPRHWKEELQQLRTDYDRLVAERGAATATSNARHVLLTPAALEAEPAVATLSSADAARPGQDFVVTATVAPSSQVKWVRLRYRHLTQYEDYQTAEMAAVAGKAGTYQAQIPNSFLDPQWDLMYFVEVMGTNGRGRMYPDLEKGTPYVVVSVRR